jgi:hypothetical protein
MILKLTDDAGKCLTNKISTVSRCTGRLFMESVQVGSGGAGRDVFKLSNSSFLFKAKIFTHQT